MEAAPVSVEEHHLAQLQLIVQDLPPDYLQAGVLLRKASQEASEKGDGQFADLLGLIMRCCSLQLVPGNAAHPFRAMWEAPRGASVSLDDFTSNDLACIQRIGSTCSPGLVAGRLNDLAWHCMRPRDPEYAIRAIDGYLTAPVSELSWNCGAKEAIYRAIALARMIKSRAGERLASIEVMLSERLLSASFKDGYFAAWIADCVLDHRFGRVPLVQVAEHLCVIAGEFSEQGVVASSGDYFLAAALRFRLAGEEVREADSLLRAAEAKVLEAEARRQGEGGSEMAASIFLEEAIHTLRRIPGRARAALGVTGRIDELLMSLRESRNSATNEFRTVSTRSVDVTSIRDACRERVAGKSLPEALKELALIADFVNAEGASKRALAELRASPLVAWVGGRVVGRDGRVVAIRPSFDLTNPETGQNTEAVFAQMVQGHMITIGLRAQAMILPALDVICAEHAVTFSSLQLLCYQSPVVPPDREGLVAMGLHYGFERDWVAAVHVLAPQLENIVRFHLKRAGVITTSMDASGVTNEVGLSSLMELPEVESVFGDDLAFEIRALFCSHFGPNLRNEIAHGLLASDDFHSASSVYAWWFLLSLVKRAWLSENVMQDDKHNE